MALYLNNPDNIGLGADERMIVSPTQQIPNQSNGQKNKLLRPKREFHWIKH